MKSMDKVPHKILREGRLLERTSLGGDGLGNPEEEDMNRIRTFCRDDSGAVAAEEGMIIALISVVAIVGIALFGGNLGQMFDGFPIKLPL
jgi:Flp pilus assembly pilin Flp